MRSTVEGRPMSPSLSETIRTENIAVWDAMQAHRFVAPDFFRSMELRARDRILVHGGALRLAGELRDGDGLRAETLDAADVPFATNR